MITTTTIVLYNTNEKKIISEVGPNIRCEIPDEVSIFIGSILDFYEAFPEYDSRE